jgi:hypothetical protein
MKLFSGWSELDFSAIASGALLIGDPVLAVYGLELSESFKLSSTKSHLQSWDSLLKAYRFLNNSDAFHGVLTIMDADSSDMYSLLEQKNYHERNWLSLWSLEDSILQANDSKPVNYIHGALVESGHYYTVDQMLKSSSEAVKDEQFQSLWRLEKWDIENGAESYQTSQKPNEALYYCLEKFSRSTSLHSLDDVINTTLKKFQLQKFEDIIPFLEIKEAIGIRLGKLDVDVTFLNWINRSNELLETRSFQMVEKYLAVRSCLYSGFIESGTRHLETVKSSYAAHLLNINKLAMEHNELLVARVAALKYKKLMEDPLLKDRADSLLQKVEWARGEHVIAMKFFKHKLDRMTTQPPSLEMIEMLHDLGIWSMTRRNSTPSQIIEEYLKPSVDLLEKCENVDISKYGNYYYDIAKYADDVYLELKNDETFKRSEDMLNQKIENLKQLQVQNPPPKNKDYFVKKLTKQIDLDQGSVEAMQAQRASVLKLSIENYLKKLVFAKDRSEHAVFRLISLWFSNFSSHEVNSLICEYMNDIDSSVFLVLAYQIAARLSSLDKDKKSPFFTTLTKFLEKIIIDYPYHTIGYLITLRNVSKEKGKGGISNNASSFMSNLAKSRGELVSIIKGMDNLFLAYFSVANQPIPTQKTKDNKYLLPSGSGLLSIHPKHELPVLTAEIPISKPRDYTSMITMEMVDKYFTLPGGINAPKVVKCRGSDGKIYRQLVKAKDDLRQDAVLSSVFAMINKLLKRHAQTRQMNLAIRTYRIVPLATQAGIVQWVDGTDPLGDTLNNAYQSYGPVKGEWALSKCRNKMKEEQEKSSGNAKGKLKMFKDIEAHLSPIFSKIFFKLYREPSEWYKNRCSYMKSVAASSIGGYLLGVGDRHAQNLLFDRTTGEIIHIDLGIAFDQGKLLSTPETIPFRLTRNMVDAMGITNVEGEFKRGCEGTLKVLREEKEIIFTLLDVFRYDPLYSW